MYPLRDVKQQQSWGLLRGLALLGRKGGLTEGERALTKRVCTLGG